MLDVEIKIHERRISHLFNSHNTAANRQGDRMIRSMLVPTIKNVKFKLYLTIVSF